MTAAAPAKEAPHFIEIKDPLMPIRIIRLIIKHKLAVTFWFKAQALRFQAPLTSFSGEDSQISFALPDDVTPQRFAAAMAAQGENTIFACVQIDDVYFFFKTTLAAGALRHASVNLALPRPIYKLQRRADIRIPFKRKVAPKITVLDPSKIFDPDHPVQPTDVMQFRLTDLSVSGLGFAARVELADKFQKGAMIKDMRFLMHGLEIKCHGVIQHCVKTKNEDDQPILKVGVKFHKLKAEYGRQIFTFVLDKSRELFQILYSA